MFGMQKEHGQLNKTVNCTLFYTILKRSIKVYNAVKSLEFLGRRLKKIAVLKIMLPGGLSQFQFSGL